MSFNRNFYANLSEDNYQIESPQTRTYNALAWVIEGTREFEEEGRWWSPDFSGSYYWPENVPRNETLGTYIEIFRLHGYEQSEGNNDNLESGFEKIAIYCKSGMVTHVAKQTNEGRWTSKLGQSHDVIHDTLASLEGETKLGFVSKILKKQL